MRFKSMRTDPDLYDHVAPIYARYAERTTLPLTHCLLEMTRVGRGDRVLDVACGTGVVSLCAAAQVGKTGQVVGIDLSPGQLRQAAHRARQQGCTRVLFALVDAMDLSLPDATFDVATAQFPHLPDRGRCLAEIARTLKPGGRFAICNGGGGARVWPLESAPVAEPVPPEAVVDGLFSECVEEYFPELSSVISGNAPRSTGDADPRNALEAELGGCGLEEVSIWSYGHVSPFSSAERLFEWECVRNSNFRMRRPELDLQSLEAFEEHYRRRANEVLARFGVLGMSTGALFGTGVRAK
jgi:ubiquinone/menaquinone biosynthesis C-methylase UbiE